MVEGIYLIFIVNVIFAFLNIKVGNYYIGLFNAFVSGIFFLKILLLFLK